MRNVHDTMPLFIRFLFVSRHSFHLPPCRISTSDNSWPDFFRQPFNSDALNRSHFLINVTKFSKGRIYRSRSFLLHKISAAWRNIFTLHTKLSLRLSKCHTMNTYCGSEGIAPRIINLGDRWKWEVSFTSRLLYPRRKEPPDAHWIGSCVGPRAGMNTVEKRRILSPCRDSKLDRPARSLVTIPTELSRLPFEVKGMH
jgi:hypothetical protein